ncbi:hypothetical protein FO519_009715 [Halicephalobus sp. NKZ332]|nr:hypothetical protein FO519_009715 [Halicephalobus sp. NKZ332]
MDVDVRAVNVNQLVKDRATEIQKMFLAFKAGRGTRTPMQRLPRHMRRRAMSHNVKRMPRNWRNYAINATKKSKHRAKPPSRFYRRRRIFADGSDECLRTHRWHAKRYRMIKAFGTKIAHKCFQKVQRSCVRNSAKGCCIVDHSYWKIVKVEASKGFESALKTFARIKSLPNFEDGRCHQLVLYSPEAKTFKNCLGPVLVWKKKENSPGFFEFCLHPAVVPGFFENFSRFLPNVVEKRAILTFYGPESLKKIVETLKLKCDEEKENLFNDVIEGALVVGSLVFNFSTKIDEKVFDFQLIYRKGPPEMILDLVFDEAFEKEVFYKFVHNRCRVLGLFDEENKIVPMSRIFDLEEKPKINKRQKRKLKKQKVSEEVEEPGFKIPQGTVIGRIVRGLRWTSRQGAYYGFGYCSKRSLDNLMGSGKSTVFFRNPDSQKYREAKVVVVDKSERF